MGPKVGHERYGEWYGQRNESAGGGGSRSWAPITGPGYLVPVFDGNGTANSTNATNATVTTTPVTH